MRIDFDSKNPTFRTPRPRRRELETSREDHPTIVNVKERDADGKRIMGTCDRVMVLSTSLPNGKTELRAATDEELKAGLVTVSLSFAEVRTMVEYLRDEGVDI